MASSEQEGSFWAQNHRDVHTRTPSHGMDFVVLGPPPESLPVVVEDDTE